MNQKTKKILVLIPDGVGLRNFVYSSFPELGERKGFEIIFWNQTSKDLKAIGFQEIKLDSGPASLSDLYKRAKIETELNHFTNKFQDPVYQSYKFPHASRGIKTEVKNVIVKGLVNAYSGQKGIQRLQRKMEDSERRTRVYLEAQILLSREKPDMVLCTNQRPLAALAPLLAARDLGIKTASFIFSWDNLPKATKIIDTDYYLVWSELMKKELLNYYPHLRTDQVVITGSPQFEIHFKENVIKTREQFFEAYQLDYEKSYLCFSGDDVTTSPKDELYLEDIANAVEEMNNHGNNVGIIFRKSPVDFTGRYEKVVKAHPDTIVQIDPLWEKTGKSWNEILPLREDGELQANIISHTFMVVNLGSSMVFDFAIHDKPCAFLNYDPSGVKLLKGVETIYKFVHFRSMPDGAVIWLNSKDEIVKKLTQIHHSAGTEVVDQAKKWFENINVSPPIRAVERIWQFLMSVA